MGMRIIAGSARGRRILSTSKTMMVKPISGRMRQSLFDILRPIVTGSYFLDLFAGTGAVGLEALSRGASKIAFVEKDSRCLKVIKSNLTRFNWEDKGVVLRGDALNSLSWVSFRAGVEKFEIVFLGPPYRKEDNTPLAYTAPVLENIAQARLLASNGLVVAQHHKKEEVKTPQGLKRYRLMKYGDTTMSFYRTAAAK